MKIRPTQQQELHSIYQKKMERGQTQSGVEGGKGSTGQAASLELSSHVQLIHRGVEAADQAQGTSPERLAELREAVQNGTYQVDAEQLANRLLEELG